MKILQPLLNKTSGLMKRLAGQFNPSGLSLALSLAIFNKNNDGRSAASTQEEEHLTENSLRSKEHTQKVNENRKKKNQKEDDKRVAALIGAGIIPNGSQQANTSFRSRIEQSSSTNITLKNSGKPQDWEQKITNTPSNPSTGLTT